MNRRGFLKLFSASLPTAIVAPKYFFAPVGGWQRGSYHMCLVGADALVLPQESLRVWYDKKFMENLRYQLPQSLLGRTVMPLVAGDFLRGCYLPQSALSLEDPFSVHFPDTKINIKTTTHFHPSERLSK